MKAKSIFSSWTIWLNVLAGAGIGWQLINNTHLVIDVDLQAVILAVLNILLRFKTKQAVRI